MKVSYYALIRVLLASVEGKGCVFVSPPVPVRIVFLKEPEPQHHWCFPFAVDGNPAPSIRWLFNGTLLVENMYTYTQLIPDSDDGSVQHGCLFLNKPTHLNNGYYTLIVENALGRDQATASGKFMDNPFDPFDPEGIIPGENMRSFLQEVHVLKPLPE